MSKTLLDTISQPSEWRKLRQDVYLQSYSVGYRRKLIQEVNDREEGELEIVLAHIHNLTKSAVFLSTPFGYEMCRWLSICYQRLISNGPWNAPILQDFPLDDSNRHDYERFISFLYCSGSIEPSVQYFTPLGDSQASALYASLTSPYIDGTLGSTAPLYQTLKLLNELNDPQRHPSYYLEQRWGSDAATCTRLNAGSILNAYGVCAELHHLNHNRPGTKHVHFLRAFLERLPADYSVAFWTYLELDLPLQLINALLPVLADISLSTCSGLIENVGPLAPASEGNYTQPEEVFVEACLVAVTLPKPKNYRALRNMSDDICRELGVRTPREMNEFTKGHLAKTIKIESAADARGILESSREMDNRKLYANHWFGLNWMGETRFDEPPYHSDHLSKFEELCRELDLISWFEVDTGEANQFNPNKILVTSLDSLVKSALSNTTIECPHKDGSIFRCPNFQRTGWYCGIGGELACTAPSFLNFLKKPYSST